MSISKRREGDDGEALRVIVFTEKRFTGAPTDSHVRSFRDKHAISMPEEPIYRASLSIKYR